jgi:hypothetical protein
MTMTTYRKSDSFSVQGRVFDVTTKQGIEGLLVTVYGLNGDAGREAESDLDALLKNATRLGSVPCGEDGFSFNYDKNDILAINGEKPRLDLLIVITAPDDENNGSAEKVVYYSNPPRMDAGRVETFNIGISHGTVEKFRLDGEVSIKERVSSYKRERTNERALAAGIVDFHQAEIERDTEEKAAFRAEVLNTIATNVDVASLPGEVI